MKRWRYRQADLILAHVLADWLEDVRSRAQRVRSLVPRITITKGIKSYSLTLTSGRRHYHLLFTKGSQVLHRPEARQLISNFHLWKTLRLSSKAVVMPKDNECPHVCAFREPTNSISVVHSIGWDLAKGTLLLVALPDESRTDGVLFVPRLVTV